MSINLDLHALSVDDIIEEYKILHEGHQKLKTQTENDAQRIYELKRNLDTALAAEAYLTQELEQLGSQPPEDRPGVEVQELEELRRKFRSLQVDHDTLQQDYDAKAEEASALRNQLAAAERGLAANSTSKDAHEECHLRFHALENENSELLQKLAEHEEFSVKHILEVAEKDKTIECLQDQVSCLEQNLQCKRSELEEKEQQLYVAQEEVVDANAKIFQLTSAPQTNEPKGNSLFAEVDDQRQVMKQLLAAQKKSYLDMKKTFTESEFEIRRLKRENVAMHRELQACSTIFCSADKTYQNKLNERIRQLMRQNETLEQQLNVSQERLREVASEKNVTWLDSMLEFCKRETDEQKAQLHSMRIQKAALDEQMRSVQKEMARWRFESLKSRCVLIDRENLLTEHKIAFKHVQAMEFNIKEAELKAALPRIVSVATESPAPRRLTETVVKDAEAKEREAQPAELTGLPCVKQETAALREVQTPIQLVPNPECKELEVTKNTPVILKEEVTDKSPAIETLKPVKKGTPVKARAGGIKVKREEKSVEAAKPLMKGTPIKSRLKTECEDQTPQKESSEEAEDEDNDLSIDNAVKPVMKGTPIKPRLGVIKVKSNEMLMGKQEPEQEKAKSKGRKGTPLKQKQLMDQDYDSDVEYIDSSTPNKIEIEDATMTPAKPLRKGTPVRSNAQPSVQPAMQGTTNINVRSILTKKREIFAEDSHKMVQFSGSSPVVHNLSPVEQQMSDAKENEKPKTAGAGGQDIKPTIKGPNIIRRIVIGSRQPKK
ncbi:protein Spindly [Drosophila pseudoobscura]|uniref:Protein Spindly n=1 Tax=Drosophila pseudoobscura pseudoobscura TaxID=46245 RepID=A0A6I8UK72_DROPS|nr:protein Spindly [Drosophila pseudoobscura]